MMEQMLGWHRGWDREGKNDSFEGNSFEILKKMMNV
jgi:hypothetical protein